LDRVRGPVVSLRRQPPAPHRLVPSQALHAAGGRGAVVDPDPGAVRSREALLLDGLRVRLEVRAGRSVPGFTAARRLRCLNVVRSGVSTALYCVLSLYYY